MKKIAKARSVDINQIGYPLHKRWDASAGAVLFDVELNQGALVILAPGARVSLADGASEVSCAEGASAGAATGSGCMIVGPLRGTI